MNIPVEKCGALKNVLINSLPFTIGHGQGQLIDNISRVGAIQGLLVVIFCLSVLAGQPVLADGYAIFSPQIVANLKARQAHDPAAASFFNGAVTMARDAIDMLPSAQETLVIEGHLDSTDAQIVNDDMILLNAFGVDAQFNRFQPSFEAAKRYLLAWAKRYRPTGNPIDEEVFFKYVGGYELVRSYLDAESKMVVDDFLRTLFQQAVRFVAAKQGFTAFSNFESRHLQLVTAIAFTLDDPAMISYCENKYRDLVNYNILPGGTVAELFPAAVADPRYVDRLGDTFPRGATLDFVHRDAMEYHTASIGGLLGAVLVARHQNVAWERIQAATGQTLFDALDFTVPYATGAKTHEEFARSIVSFDRDHDRGGEFDPKRALQLLAMAATLDGRYRSFADPSVLPPFERLVYYGETGAP